MISPRFFVPIVASLALLPASPAFSQGTYVSAFLAADIVPRSGIVSNEQRRLSLDGAAMGFALRLGTPLGRIWGVELEYSHPSAIETDEPDVLPLSAETSAIGTSAQFGRVIDPGSRLVGVAQFFSYRARASRRHDTVAASVWARQEISPKVSLVYLGGIGFQRTEVEVEFGFDQRLAAGFPISIQPPMNFSNESVNYTVGPFVGFEARIGLTEHVQLVPGVRLHGLGQGGGWLFRPAVGLGWMF